MQISSKIYKWSSLLALAAGLNGCQKFLQVPNPPNEVLLSETYKDSLTAVGAVQGIYSQMMTNAAFEWGGLANITSQSADDVDVPGGSVYSWNNFLYIYDLQGITYTAMWAAPFRTLVQVNSCIEGLQSNNALTTALRNQLLGEALFCRAYENFYLVNLWGDAAPLQLSSDLGKAMLAPSTPAATIYKQIVQDLQQAENLLIPDYPTTGHVRPNQYAAKALLARVYLYMKDYADARTTAADVINSGLYTPLPAPGAAFLSGSQEAIWQLAPNSTTLYSLGATPDGTLYAVGTTGNPPYICTQFLINAFETGDLRRKNWVYDMTDGSGYSIPYKYKDPGKFNNTVTEYYIMLRAAEQYLIRAEANVRLGSIPDAMNDLNVVRSRAGLAALSPSLSQADAMAAVEHERQVELFSEWGHRWLDLKRWPGLTDPASTRADEVLGAEKPGFWAPYCKLYLVPQTDLTLDPNLKQNPNGQ